MNLLLSRKLCRLLFSILMVFVFSACFNRIFDGSRVKNDTEFLLDFDYMNQEEKHVMSLQQSSLVLVEIQKEFGTMEIVVKDSNNIEIYRGNSTLSSRFTLTIPTTDEYTFIVLGKKAKGYVHFRMID